MTKLQELNIGELDTVSGGSPISVFLEIVAVLDAVKDATHGVRGLVQGVVVSHANDVIGGIHIH